ncbi:MAG TPA: aminotransferase class IV family protein [Candidatus Caccocola faecipullorum]|nr:aminotransferase class IV family protein [Candidatus Caccocola faecipullorum]
MVICYYNGKFAPMPECTLPMTDLAIQRGVGTFETIRIYNGVPFAMAQHLERLAGSTEGAGIKAGAIIAKLPEIIREGLARPEIKGYDGVVKPYITGGDVNDKGTFPTPRFFVVFDENIHKPTNEERKNGIALEPNHVARPYPLIKSTNYLFGFIPLSKASQTNFESLYITPEGEITEAMSSNFFLCKEGKLITAPVGRVLKGVTRDIVITLARENGFTVEERCPREEELAQADEAFITGTVKEVLPVVRVGSQKIGAGRPGPAVQRLQHIFLQNMPRWMDK